MIDKHIYLYELVRIVRKLYPKKSVSHAFSNELLSLSDRFNATDLLLLDDLIKAIALLNQSGGEKILLATKADFNNAVYLMTDPADKLS